MPTTTPSSSKKSAKRRSSAAASSAGDTSAPVWPKCELTGLHYYIADEERHKIWAAPAATAIEAESRPRLGHNNPHTLVDVAAGLVSGPARRLAKDDLPPKWRRLPEFVRRTSVFMAEPLMSLLGIGFGDRVVFAAADSVCRVWPMNFGALPPASICEHVATADDSLLLCAGDSVLLRKMPRCGYPAATSVKFRVDPTKLAKDSLKDLEFLVSDQCRGELSVRHDSVVCFPFLGSDLELKVVSLETSALNQNPNLDELTMKLAEVELNSHDDMGFANITDATVLKILVGGDEDRTKLSRQPPQDIEKVVGGLRNEIDALKKALKVLDVSEEQRFRRLGFLNGILLWGPPGTGKTLLAKNIGDSLRLPYVELDAAEIVSKIFGETEENLRAKFAEARDMQPCLLLIDNIDVLCPRKDSGGGKSDQERRTVAAVAAMMDSLNRTRERVVVLATTHQRDRVDSALLRPGRLELELEIGVPTSAARKDILESLLPSLSSGHNLEADDVDQVAKATHGYVGMDLKALLVEAEGEKEYDEAITMEDVMRAMKQISPSAMREVLIDVPTVTWSDIGGLEDLKLALKQAVEWPLKRPEVFAKFGIKPPKGLLMYGPPGCSKTMIAKALANESGLNFLAIKGPELFSKWVGESERAVRELFRKAKQVAPAIIFFDEIDALGSERNSGGGSGKVGDRVLAQMLAEMDGIEQLKDVTIVAATNRPDMIDPALMRPGRFDRIFYVQLPDAETRRKVFEVHTRKKPVSDEVSFEELVEMTEGYSGAEIEAVCNEAGMKAIEEDFDASAIERRHFERALQCVTPRIDQTSLLVYQKFSESRTVK